MPLLLHGLGYKPDISIEKKDLCTPLDCKTPIELTSLGTPEELLSARETKEPIGGEEEEAIPRPKGTRKSSEYRAKEPSIRQESKKHQPPASNICELVAGHLVTGCTSGSIQDGQADDYTTITENVFGETGAAMETIRLKHASKGFTLGGPSPFPTLAGPSVEECQLVHDILSAEHGHIDMPKDIPPPSQTVAGCGEVNFVLEALMRTLISTHTHMQNADKAIKQLYSTYRVFQRGDYAGSIDWEDVRLRGPEALEVAIRPAGKSVKSSKAIASILNHVKDENDAIRRRINVQRPPVLAMVGKLTRAQILAGAALRKLETDSSFLTLDYLHLSPPTQAFDYLQQFPEVGVKTAACLLLFCFQYPTLAVDTHVWRLSKLLAWVPHTATRNETFFHLDQAVPHYLKYAIHQLFIAHGKNCSACSGRTQAGTERSIETTCVLDRLVGSRRSILLSTKSNKKSKTTTKPAAMDDATHPKQHTSVVSVGSVGMEQVSVTTDHACAGNSSSVDNMPKLTEMGDSGPGAASGKPVMNITAVTSIADEASGELSEEDVTMDVKKGKKRAAVEAGLPERELVENSEFTLAERNGETSGNFDEDGSLFVTDEPDNAAATGANTAAADANHPAVAGPSFGKITVNIAGGVVRPRLRAAPTRAGTATDRRRRVQTPEMARRKKRGDSAYLAGNKVLPEAYDRDTNSRTRTARHMNRPAPSYREKEEDEDEDEDEEEVG